MQVKEKVDEGEAKLVARYRAAHPRSRVMSILRYVRNGPIVKQRGCILCSWVTHTWDGRWLKPQLVEHEETIHILYHLSERFFDGLAG